MEGRSAIPAREERAHGPGRTFAGYNYDPELASVLPFSVSLPFAAVDEARRVEDQRIADSLAADEKSLSARDVVIEDLTAGGGQPSGSVPIRIYRPKVSGGERPGCLVFFHGGGFVLGGLDAEHSRCAQYADEARCLVVSAGYRLAPEHPYPAGFDDCYATLLWVTDNASDLGGDPSRIGVAGTSAGGGLAAAVALRARDECGPELALQLLVYPTLDSRMQSPSAREFSSTPGWNSDFNRLMWDYYLGGGEPGPYAAPALARSLKGLAPATVIAAEFDPLRDEAIEYALGLLRAQVPTELHVYRGTFHGFDVLAPFAGISQRAVADQVASIRQALRR
jgi:acetyl esterase/lipase